MLGRKCEGIRLYQRGGLNKLESKRTLRLNWSGITQQECTRIVENRGAWKNTALNFAAWARYHNRQTVQGQTGGDVGAY